MLKALSAITSVLILSFYLTGCASLQTGGSRIKSRVLGGTLGQEILRTAEIIAFEQKRIIRGSCWDFVNEVYNEAGYPENKRTIVFKGSSAGPYANVNDLKPGDWVMHINMEYHNVEHSSIFIGWADRGKKLAKVLDYAGMDKARSGGYDKHTYAKIFCIVRPLKE